MTSWHTEGSLPWRELSPFGVEIDTDLSRPLGESQNALLVELFWRFGLLIARNQQLSMEQQRELLTGFGPILIRQGESGYLSNQGEHDAARSGLSFHCDAAYTTCPFDAIALHGVDVVDGASSTRFVHAERAHDRLPGELRETLANREVELISPGFDILAARVCDVQAPSFMQRGIRPAVMLNPNTGRHYLNVSEMHAACIVDLPWQESRDLLNAVYDTLYAEDNLYEHYWHKGDLVIWDNQALQHARGSLAECGTRILQRVIVGEAGAAPHVYQQRSS